MKYLSLFFVLLLLLMPTALKGVEVDAYPPIDLVQLPSDELIYAEVREDDQGLFYEIILVRADGIFEKGILRFQCREDQDGGDVCYFVPRPYSFKAWYRTCNRAGECEDQLGSQDIAPRKVRQAWQSPRLSL